MMDYFTVSVMQSEILWPLVIVSGFLIGSLTGLFGVGGGFLLTPILKILFGIPYPVAVGSSLPLMFVTSSYTSVRYWRQDNVDPRMAVIVGVGALIGTRVGKFIMAGLEANRTTVHFLGSEHSVLDLTLNILFAVLMSGIGIYVWNESSSKNDFGDGETSAALPKKVQSVRVPPCLSFPKSGIENLSFWIPVVASFTVGILTGLLGVGGGFVNFPLLVYVIGLPTVLAVGTSAAQVTLASAYGGYLYFTEGKVAWLLVGLLLLGSLPGARFGTWVSGKIGGRKIRRYFSLVLACGVLLVVWGIVQGE